MKKLTTKQEKFVLSIVQGMNKTEAYKSVYDTSKMKPNTINKKAYDLFNKPNIQARYDELMEELKEKSIWTMEKAIDELIWIKDKAKTDILDKGLKPANSNTFMSAIKELNTLLNLYPKKNNDEDDKEDNIANELLGIMDGIRGLHNGTK